MADKYVNEVGVQTIKAWIEGKCARYSTAATALAVPDKAWLNINATYISAS